MKSIRTQYARVALAMLALAGTAWLASPVRADGAEGAKQPIAAPSTDSRGAISLGTEAPMRDVPMKATDGKSYSIKNVAGKNGTLVVFTCNHCPWAKRWQDRITAIGAAAQKSGIGVIAINSNDPNAYPEDSFDNMVARAKQLKLRFPYAMDATSEIGRAFGATHTPESFLFDAKGKLIYHGGVDDNAEDASAVKEHWLHDAVVAAAAGTPIANAETKAMGCSIKLREPEH